MERDAIVAKIAEISETDADRIADGTRLDELEAWDSLSYVVFVGFAVTAFGVQLTADEMTRAETVGDLVSLVLGKR